MSAQTVPVLLPKWQGGSFNVVRVPIWERSYITDIDENMVYCSFFAHPNKAETLLKFEYFDGDNYVMMGVVVAKTASLITANDTGYQTILNIVLVHYNALYRELARP